MAIAYHILGAVGRDNVVFVRVVTGQAVYRLLFDCGDQCLSSLPRSELQAVDHLLFSHLHMDHIAGFDGLFRLIYNDPARPHRIWGPPQTSRIMHHRFRGFLWNLHAGQSGTWYVNDIDPDRTVSWRFELAEGFELAHPSGEQVHGGTVIEGDAFTVEALMLNHQTPSMGYIVREKPRININSARLAGLGLRAGPWLQQIKEGTYTAPTIEIDGASYDVAALRAMLLVETPGASIAYLTDFVLDDATEQRLVSALHGCTTVICESQYCHADHELAQRNYHLTASQAAWLARRASVGQLVLFHFSERYRGRGWRMLLEEAQAIFPATTVPEHWDLDPPDATLPN